MDEDTFDLIMQQVLEQKQLMEQLEEENRQLRRQLADLYEAQARSRPRHECLDLYVSYSLH
jgi:hypothetical protein